MISEIHDINPKTWLNPFQKIGVFYLLKMGLFYLLLGLILMYGGSFLATTIIPGYEIPQIPVSISLALSAGLLEEAVFFGIPYYMSGRRKVLLGFGVIWSLAHLFNSGVYSLNALAYGGFLFSIPHIFFSIRTWSSKKGWFAIIFHSIWNLIILLSFCGMGLRQCVISNGTYDVLNVIMSVSAIMIVYLAYQSTKKEIKNYLFLIPVAIITFSLIILFSDQIILFFS